MDYDELHEDSGEMTNARVALFCFFALLADHIGVAQTVVAEAHGPRCSQRVVRLEPGKFTLGNIKQLWGEWQAVVKDDSISQLIVVTKDSDSAFATNGKGVDHTSFATWREVYQQTKPFDAAEVLRLKDKTVIRMSAKDRTVQVKDPDGALKLGELTLSYVSFDRVGFTTVYEPHLYLISAHLLKDNVARFAGRLQQELRLESLIVSAGTEGWFVDEGRYPWVNPFEQHAPLPTSNQLHDGLEIYCRVAVGNLTVCDENRAQSVLR